MAITAGSSARLGALEPAAADTATEAERLASIDAAAAMPHACSYDGAPVRIGAVGDALPSDCRDMVAHIMQFTGLPQNFTVVEAKVPNAAAVIMLDARRIPQRVIAFNEDFIAIVRRATDGNAWAPVSIMAHEIGHHLSGHTITPGGSQPPTELEADKFSGFVLYKMGASLADAQTAMSALVADGPDGPTHPGRGKRLRAIADGWQQACAQQRGDCNGGRSVAGTASAPMSPAPPPARTDASASAAPHTAPVRLPEATPAPVVARASEPVVDRLPKPDPDAVPAKGTQFIHDEFGLLDRDERAKWEQVMFEHARDRGVEIVTLLVRDLHGLDADDYAWAMMRQLRVGKLDVGNGAVLVIAPQQGAVGHAFGPGVQQQLESRDPTATMRRWIDVQWPHYCMREAVCNAFATESLLSAARSVIDNTRHVEWTLRYHSFDELAQAYREDFEARRGERHDPALDRSNDTLARVEGTVVAIDVRDREHGARVNAALTARGWLPVLLRTVANEHLMLYVGPHTQALMPVGALRAGRRYSAVGRVQSVSWNPKDTSGMFLLSYDVLD